MNGYRNGVNVCLLFRVVESHVTPVAMFDDHIPGTDSDDVRKVEEIKDNVTEDRPRNDASMVDVGRSAHGLTTSDNNQTVDKNVEPDREGIVHSVVIKIALL